jgi:hypothetical protein
MDDQMAGVEDRASSASEFLDTVGYEIYATPSGQVIQMMKQFTGPAIILSVGPD